MQIKNVFNTARRNTSSTLLLIIQAALTIAILANLVSMINNRLDEMDRPSGIDESVLLKINLYHFGQDFRGDEVLNNDIEVLKQLPQVESVTRTNQVPFDGSGSSGTFSNKPFEEEGGLRSQTAFYRVDENFAETMGLKFVAGRDILIEEKTDLIEAQGDYELHEAVVITSQLAQALFGRVDVVGENVYGMGFTGRVVGVVERLETPWPKWMDASRSLYWSRTANNAPFQRIAVRLTDSANVEEAIQAIEKTIYETYPDRVIQRLETYPQIRARHFSIDSALIFSLTLVLGMLIAVVSLGSIGMATFNVERRTKAIGTRRAIGATKSDIVIEFLTESGMILLAAMVIGIPLAMLLNWQLMAMFSVEQLSWGYPVAVGIALLVLSLIGILYPAFKASSIAPSIATRTA